MAKPCNHKDNEYVEKCYICNLVLKNPAYRRLYLSQSFPQPKKVQEPPCMYLGKRVRDEDNKIKQVVCTEGCAKGTLLDVFECEVYGEVTLTKCRTCKLKRLASSKPNTLEKLDGIFSDAKNSRDKVEEIESVEIPEKLTYLNSKIAVGIGTQGWPGLTELQIKTIKHNCGNIPILICDDHSEGCSINPDNQSVYGRLVELTKKYDKVEIWPNPVQFGHGAGDLSVFYKLLTWATTNNIDYVAKLSRRLLIDVPYWLQYWTNILIKDNHVICIQKQLSEQWALSTNGVILRTDYWNKIIDKFRPINLNSNISKIYVENIFEHILNEKLEGTHTPFSLLSKNPKKKSPGILWHPANTLEDYKNCFLKYNVKMDQTFSVECSAHLDNFKIG